MTWLWPLIAHCLKSKKALTSNTLLPSSIAILIPVHNDALRLGSTLQSISDSASTVSINISVTVCIDHSSDNSADVAKNARVNVIFNNSAQGKWHAIRALISSTNAEWIGLVDAGSIWPKTLLSTVITSISSNVVAVAPAYGIKNSGMIEKILWWIERNIKSLEARTGGPVAVHGATVFYLRSALLEVFKTTADRDYSNDDVVIPLLIRSNNPTKEIVYLKESVVSDVGAKSDTKDFGRRRRMVLGNIDWVRELFPKVLRSDVNVALLALRRIFRIFWAYWFIAIALALLSITTLISPMLSLICGLLSLALISNRALRGACMASLLAPYYIFFPIPREARRWR